LCADAMIEPEIEMGKESVKMLIEKIKKPDKQIKSLLLNFSYFETGTVKKC